MKKLFIVLVILSFVENTMAQIKMAQLPEKEKKEVVFVYDSLTNVERHNTEKREYYYKHLAGQKITGISLSDYYPMIGLRNSDFLNATEDLKRIEGMSFRIDSVGYGYKNSRNFDRVDIFYVSEDNNPNNKLEIFSDAEYGWTQINLAWVCHGYFEKIKQLYLGKELVYINQDNEDDIQEYTHSKDRFIDYNTSRNLTKKIPCNSVWKCTDVLVLPGKLNFRDCDNRVILNLENEQHGKYYVFASELIKRRDWKNNRYFMTMEDFHKYQAVQNQLREVAKVKAAKAAAESVKRAKEHREYIIAKYGETYGSLILQGRVVIGMTKDQCIESWGHPSRINRTTTALTIYEQWVYGNRYLYFENSKLVTIQDKTMQRSNKINASSLCHFTKKFDTLQNIVKNGIRFSFAFEKLSPATIANFEYPSNPQLVAHIYKNAGVAIPMVSFCDIPITRATDHIAKYGQYMIGLDKEFIIDTYNKIINPVFYIHSDNLYQAIDDISNVYAEATNQQMQEAIKRWKSIKDCTQKTVEEIVKEIIEKCPYHNRKFSSQFIVGLSKPCYSKDGKVCYYDEREWRAFWPDGISEVANWKWGITYEDYLSNRNDWNKDLMSDKINYITIPEGFLYFGITHIVVKNDDQVPKMIDLIMRSKTIFGQSNVSQKERLILVSKITSLERIAKDY